MMIPADINNKKKVSLVCKGPNQNKTYSVRD